MCVCVCVIGSQADGQKQILTQWREFKTRNDLAHSIYNLYHCKLATKEMLMFLCVFRKIRSAINNRKCFDFCGDG